MIKALLILTTALATLLSVACSVLPKSAPIDLYQLPAPSLQTSSTAEPRLPALKIDRPLTSDALNGSRLLIMTANNQFRAFSNMRLAAPVPLLWRDWLLDAFWRDGRVEGLSATSQGLQSAIELGGTLRAFHVDYASAQAEAVIQYDATLITTAGRRIIASKRFEARQPLASVEASAAIAALGVAANQLAGELIDWTIQQSSRD